MPEEAKPTKAELRRAAHIANQRWHFKKRARQRLGLELLDDDCEEILDRIKRDKPGVIYLAVRRGASAWRVRWRKKFMVVLFDHRTGQLVTCYKWQKWRWYA